MLLLLLFVVVFALHIKTKSEERMTASVLETRLMRLKKKKKKKKERCLLGHARCRFVLIKNIFILLGVIWISFLPHVYNWMCGSYKSRRVAQRKICIIISDLCDAAFFVFVFIYRGWPFRRGDGVRDS